MRVTRKFGTGIRKAFDTQRLSKSLSGPGIDTRHWVSYGTVGTTNEDGEPDFTDPLAVNIGSNGVLVDVMLTPSQVPIVCRYSGIQGGSSCTIYAPIKAGDLVLVVIPDGNAASVPVIVAVMNSRAYPLPVEPEDSKPVFRNDRLSVFSNDVPIEIRTQGGAKVRLETDGTIEATSPGGAGAKLNPNNTASFVGASVEIGGTGLSPDDGVVTGKGIDTFTGSTYFALGNASAIVKAKKV